MATQVQKSITHAITQVDESIAKQLNQRNDKQKLLKSSSSGGDIVIPQTTARWRDDNVLKTIMTDMKSQYQVLSHCCVKFTLLLSNTLGGKSKVSTEALESILDELKKTVQTLLNIYLRCLECSVAESLFDYVSQGIRTVLVHVEELLVAFGNKNKENMTYATGAITRVADEMQKLPLGNKAAYRRYVMEKCVAIKETLQEFETYISSAKEHLAVTVTPEEDLVKKVESLQVEDVAGDEEEEDDDDDFDDEGENTEYTADELLVVECSVNAIRLALDLSKSVLSIMTSVGDRIAENQSDDTEIVKHCQSIIAILVNSIDVLENQVTDLGAELYPPVQSTDAQLVSHYQLLVNNMKHTVYLLKIDTIASNLTEGEVKTLTIMEQRVHDCKGW